MGRIIAVTSGKGGVGKSSVSVHLANELALKQNKILLVDLDAGMRCLDVMLSVCDKLLFDINDVLSGEKTLEEAVLTPQYNQNISLLAAPLRDKINHIDLKNFLKTESENFDFIFLDFPAGSVDDLYLSLPAYTEALVVCNSDAVSVRDAAMIAADLKALPVMSVRLILNRVSFDIMRRGITANVDDIVDSSCLQLIGVIPQSMDLYMANCSGSTIKKSSRTKAAFERISKRILGYDVPLPKLKKLKESN